MRGCSHLAVAMAAGCLLLAGCRKPGGSPPHDAFAPIEWRSPKGVLFKPPDVANHPWRVLMLQEHPRPKKNPHWKTIPIETSGTIDMPAGSHFECVYGPVTFRTWPNEHAMIDRWDLLRSVRCSSDGWATYAEAIHLVMISPDGTVKPNMDQTELTLHETIDGKAIQTTLALRAD